MAKLTGGASGHKYDYVQATEPADADLAELWLDTSETVPETKITDGNGNWYLQTTDRHDELGNVQSDQHHAKPSGGVGLNLDTNSNVYDVITGNAVIIDGNDQVAVDESKISHDNISDVSDSDHHNPVTVSNPLTEDGSQGLGMSLGAALGLESGSLAVLDGKGLNGDADSLDVITGNAVIIDGDDQVAVDESAVSHDNISDVSEGDHRTQEQVEDIVGTLIGASGNISVSYDDGGNSLTIDTSGLNEEQVEDAVANLITSDSNLTVSYNDSGDELTIGLADSISVSSADITDPSFGSIGDSGTYTGNGGADNRAISHDLGRTPNYIIVTRHSPSGGATVAHMHPDVVMVNDGGSLSDNTAYFTLPDDSAFYLGESGYGWINDSGQEYSWFAL